MSLSISKDLKVFYSSREQFENECEEELTCMICLEPYKNPCEIPCGHVMCKDCIDDLFTTAKCPCRCGEFRKRDVIPSITHSKKVEKLRKKYFPENEQVISSEVQPKRILRSDSKSKSVPLYPSLQETKSEVTVNSCYLAKSFIPLEHELKFLSGIFFGEKDWNEIGDIGRVKPLPKNFNEIMNANCPYWPEKKVYETHMVTWIPETVNGMKVTLKNISKLNAFANWLTYCHENDNFSVKKSHWLLMTNKPPPETLNKPYKKQVKYVASVKKGYNAPKVLELAISIFLHNKKFGIHLFGKNFSLCSDVEKICYSTIGHFGVGNLKSKGILINDEEYLTDFYNVGMAACKTI